jgi:hypothetical protein
MIAAIIGGGVKLVQLEIAQFQSVKRQTALGVFGLILLLVGLSVNTAGDAPSDATSGQTRAGGVAPAGDGAAPTSVAAAADRVEGDEVVTEPTRSSEPQGLGLTGRWMTNDRIAYDLEEQGDKLKVVAHTERGTYSGEGKIQDNQISFSIDDLSCGGSVGVNPRIIHLQCAGPGGQSYELELQR